MTRWWSPSQVELTGLRLRPRKERTTTTKAKTYLINSKCPQRLGTAKTLIVIQREHLHKCNVRYSHKCNVSICTNATSAFTQTQCEVFAQMQRDHLHKCNVSIYTNAMWVFTQMQREHLHKCSMSICTNATWEQSWLFPKSLQSLVFVDCFSTKSH